MNANNPSNSLRLNCPQCAAAVRAAAHLAGKRLRCPKCGATIKVPGSRAAPEEQDEWLSMDEPLENTAAGPPAAAGANIPAKPAKASEARGSSADSSIPGFDEAWLDDLPPLTKPEATSPTRGIPQFSDSDLRALGTAGAFGEGDHAAPPKSSPPKTDPLPAAGERPGSDEYRAKCPICESVHYVRPSQAGKTINCGDCQSRFTVPPPPPQVVKKKIDLERAATFQLSEVAGDRNPSDAPDSKSAAEYLRQAESADVEEDPHLQYENPDVKAWLREIFGIFLDPAVAAYWLALSMLGAIPGMLAVAIGHPAILVGVIFVSLLYASLVLSCAFAILEAVANGQRTVEEWPVFNPVEWFGQYAMAIFAVVLSAVPGLVLGMGVFGVSLGGVACVMFSIFLLFPFVLLSILDNGNPFMPISSSVTKSVSRCKDAWGLLYFSSMLLFVLHFITVAMITSLAPPLVGVFFDALFSVAMVFMYFAMVGRLAYAIGQSINGPADDEDVD